MQLWCKEPLPPSLDFQKQTTFEKIIHYVITFFYFVIIPLTIILFACAVCIDWISNCCNACQYTHLEGNGRIKTAIKTVMTWNVCMLCFGLSIPFGGVAPTSLRISQVAQEILHHSPDLVCLQEVSQGAAYNLYNELKSEYRFFYIRINPDPILTLDSSLFVASKVQLTDEHIIPIPQGDRIRRAAFSFKAGNVTFTSTHLQPGLEPKDREMRMAQASTIVKANRIGKQVLLGDLNMEKEEFIESSFNVYHDAVPVRFGPTCIEKTYFDYVASTPDMQITTQLGQAYGDNWAISDHNPVYATIV